MHPAIPLRYGYMAREALCRPGLVHLTVRVSGGGPGYTAGYKGTPEVLSSHADLRGVRGTRVYSRLSEIWLSLGGCFTERFTHTNFVHVVIVFEISIDRTDFSMSHSTFVVQTLRLCHRRSRTALLSHALSPTVAVSKRLGSFTLSQISFAGADLTVERRYQAFHLESRAHPPTPLLRFPTRYPPHLRREPTSSTGFFEPPQRTEPPQLTKIPHFARL